MTKMKKEGILHSLIVGGFLIFSTSVIFLLSVFLILFGKLYGIQKDVEAHKQAMRLYAELEEKERREEEEEKREREGLRQRKRSRKQAAKKAKESQGTKPAKEGLEGNDQEKKQREGEEEEEEHNNEEEQEEEEEMPQMEEEIQKRERERRLERGEIPHKTRIIQEQIAGHRYGWFKEEEYHIRLETGRTILTRKRATRFAGESMSKSDESLGSSSSSSSSSLASLSSSPPTSSSSSGKTLGALLLIHGFAQNRHGWNLKGRSFVNYLAEAGYDVFYLDLRYLFALFLCCLLVFDLFNVFLFPFFKKKIQNLPIIKRVPRKSSTGGSYSYWNP